MHYLNRVKRDGLVIRIPRELWGVVAVLAATVAALVVLIASRS
jgi:hypothetical protein